MRQSACLVVNPITVNNFAVHFQLHAGGSGFRLYDGPIIKSKLTIRLVEAGHLSFLGPSGPNDYLLLLQCFSGVADAQRISRYLSTL